MPRLPRLRSRVAASCRQLWRAHANSIRHISSRPSFAPEPAIDIKHIRLSPGLYEQNCLDRNYKAQAGHSWRILELHQEWQRLQENSRKLREHDNATRRQLAALATGDDIRADKQALIDDSRQVKAELESVNAREKAIQEEINVLAEALPNLSSTDTPNGDEPTVLEYINPNAAPSPDSTTSFSHSEIGTELDLLDFAGAATTSGWGWYFLKNDAALLEQALIQYALSIALERGWTIVTPPSIVYSHIADACGFKPRDQNDEQQIYTLSSSDNSSNAFKPSLCLAGTAEIPLAGMNANRTLSHQDLPLKVIGASRCYRAEAGARGVDTKGLYRVHEFTKVEMFAWTMPPDHADKGNHFAVDTVTDDTNSMTHAQNVFFEMLAIQKQILSDLGLHCRVLEMPAADLGASASRKIDIEAFFPSRRRQGRDEGWGEVTSVSMCGDYQTRRLATRVKGLGSSKSLLGWPHTVNGTALAVPRVLAAILENNWDAATRKVRIPGVLRQWMGGREYIDKR